MPKKQWTTEQKQAIEARGGSLLISAAAGSGKTAVLVERVIGRITDSEHPCDADRLLVVTFTNAAAAEMRARLAARLHALAEERPGDANLRRQMILLQHAHISTIHAFCLNLLREHFEKLDIQPDFRIADEKEAKLLLDDALNELMEDSYAGNEEDGAFLRLTEMLGAGRDDAGLTDTILRLFDFLCSLPAPDAWLRDKLDLYRTDAPLKKTRYGQAALAFAMASLEHAAGSLREGIRAMADCEPLEKAYGGAFASLLAQVERLYRLAEAGDWDNLVAGVQGVSYERLGSARKLEDTALRDRLKGVRDAVKGQMEKLSAGVLCCSQKEYCADVEKLRPLAQSLFNVVRELDRRFYDKKAEKGILDFNDLERLAIRLLRGADGTPTPAARLVAARFDEVLVDEYQDINPAQDAIFQAVSRNGKNLFMVGDVKQSIYRFRKATPELFIQKKDAFAPYDGHTYPARIVLGRNFRSRAGIAEAVNFVFHQLMSRELGGIAYGPEEEIIPAAAYFEKTADDADFALHLLETDEYEENDDNAVLEARYVARHIAKMLHNGYAVQGSDGPRPAQCRDFCVLLRGANRLAQTYVDALKEEGLTAYANVAGGYLGSYEVEVMLSLLRVLDNPLQDIPLLSVMLSPVFGFTPDDLARLRLRQPKGPLYLAVLAQAQETDGSRFSVFVDLLNELRRLAAVLPSDRIMLRVYERTGFLDVFTAMPGGEGRRANLRLLLDYARSYEEAGFRGLAGFVRFIDRMSEDTDLPPASTVSEDADVVRVMSIHKSKGLEFPICVLAGCGRRFNREDSQRGTLFHPEYGFGSYLRDPALSCHMTTLPREVVRIETERASMAEEMRVLYVAMTRAKEKLICVATVSSAEKTAASAMELLRPDGGGIAPFAAMKAPNLAAWLVACLFRHPSCTRLRALAGLEELSILSATYPMEFVVAKAESAGTAQAKREMSPQPVDDVLLTEIERRIAFAYPHQELTRLPSKLAVSEIAEQPLQHDFGAKRPAFLEQGLSAAQKGTALHRFMQLAALEKITSEDDVSTEVERLVETAHLLPEEGNAIDAGRVLAFLRTTLFAQIRQAEHVWKELRFSLSVTAAELGSASLPDGAVSEIEEDALIVLQGMADVVFLEHGRYFILDYKTDHVGAEELRQRYAKQVMLYARAVRQIFRGPVGGCFLYGFARGALVKLPEQEDM